MVGIVLSFVAQVAGCSPTIPDDGRFSCDPAAADVEQCPEGWFCHGDGRCRSEREGEIDAAVDGRVPPSDAGRDASVDACVGASCTTATFVSLGAGANHACAVHRDGTVVCWGDNVAGQIGSGDTADPIPTPSQVLDLDDAVQVAAGGPFTCARTAAGTVRCWGSNANGRLGFAGPSRTNRPTDDVVGVVGAVDVATGFGHGVACLADGRVIGWGINSEGALGEASIPTMPPEEIAFPDLCVRVFARDHITCVVGRDRRLYCQGINDDGELGGDSADTCGVSTPCSRTPLDLGLTDVLAVGVGNDHVCATHGGATVTCWGANQSGQLGRITAGDTRQPLGIALVDALPTLDAGDRHTCGATATGAVFCWGSHQRSQLDGVGGLEDCSGEPCARMPMETTVGGALQVGALDDATCVRTDTDIVCWGANGEGQLGRGMTSGPSDIPLAISR